MKTSHLLRALGLVSLIAVCPAAYSGDTHTSSQSSAEISLKLVQIFYQFSADMYSAGLDDQRKQQLRDIQLQGIATGNLTKDRLFAHFEESWLDIEREIDQVKRVLLCQDRVLDVSPSAKKKVLDLEKDLQRTFYEKHMYLHAAVLQERYQFDLADALWKYSARSAVPRVFEKRLSNIEPPPGVSVEDARRMMTDQSLKSFCSKPWEFEFILPQKDGSVKRYRIEL